MSLQTINLRKLLKLMYLDDRALTTALRQDIRDDLGREQGSTGGPDFYGSFWSDAKKHVFGSSDLHDTTEARIKSNAGREKLYPRLRDGFLLWWNERRRWTNAPFEPIAAPTTRFRIPELDLTVKIDCILSVRDGRGDDHYVDPYWFPHPPIGDEAARLGLWMLTLALPHVPPDELRILDVIRGVTFALSRNPLTGDEHMRFSRNYERLVRRRTELRREYD